MSRKIISIALGSCLVLCIAATASAALVAEMGFNSADNGFSPPRTPITNNKPGSSDTGQLVVDAGTPVNLNTGATGLNPAFSNEVRFGFLDVVDANSGGAVSINTAGSNGNITNYLTGPSTMGQGSAVVVFKPDYSGIHITRKAWFSSAVQTNGQLWFYQGELGGPSLRVGLNGPVTDLNIANFSYDNTKWYMIGATWNDTPIGGGQVNRNLGLYIRELSTAPTTATTNNGFFPAVTAVGITAAPFYVGRRSNVGTEGADGDIALFQLYDSFFSTADFDGVYTTLFAVPEPSTLSLVGLGILGAMIRRRRQSASRRAA